MTSRISNYQLLVYYYYFKYSRSWRLSTYMILYLVSTRKQRFIYSHLPQTLYHAGY